MSSKRILYTAFLLTVAACTGYGQQHQTPSDTKATPQTVNLYNNLGRLAHKGIMIGHQDDLAYGVSWKYLPGRSDVKELVGDYPAVYGWELGDLELGQVHNLDSVPFDRMKQFIRQAYDRGGVNTISWHLSNPHTMNNAWDSTSGGVTDVLPGGPKNALFKTWLDKVADFMLSLKGKNGEPIPVLFRPYHELTGHWFWWGQKSCTSREFISLWRFTADYLRKERGVHNLLYVYNTAEFNGKEHFLERYPGDDYVDIVSFDTYAYGDSQKSGYVAELESRLPILQQVAEEHNKVMALAETGYETTPDPLWWTGKLWSAIGRYPISYVLMWRNAGRMPKGNMHYYTPQKSDPSAADFIQFYQLDKTLFNKEVTKENLYGNKAL